MEIPEKRTAIFDAIQRERMHQHTKWSAEHDATHDLPSWLLLMRMRLHNAEKAWAEGAEGKCQQKILEMITLGVASLEVHGVYERKSAARQIEYRESDR